MGFLISVGGCGKGETTVKAKVTYGGTNVNGGSIEVNCKPPKSGNIADGLTFLNMKGVSGGKYKVRYSGGKDVEPKELGTDKNAADFEKSGVEIEVKDGQANEVTIEFKK